MKTDKTHEQSWKPFIGVMRHNVPWLWYLLNLGALLFSAKLTVKLPELTGQLMAGEIFDRSIILEYTALTIFSYLISIAISLSRTWVQTHTDRNIQRTLWKKMMRLPMRELDRQAPSSLISRVTSDTTTLSYSINYLFMLINFTYSLYLMLSKIYAMNHQITYSLLLVLPYILLVMLIPGRFMFRFKKKEQATLAAFTSYVSERLMNIKLVKSSSTESQEIQLGYAVAEENYKATLQSAIVDACTQPFAYSTQGVVGAIVLIMGGILVNRGELGMDNLITMYLYSNSIYVYMLQYAFCFHNLKRAQGATKTISEILESESEEPQRQVSFTQPDADIVLENVTFRYGEQNVLDKVSLTIPRGKVTAIVGPSGAGKTTVLSLLERLYTPNEGRLLFGDTPVEDIHLNEWRGATGYIQQNSPVLSGTIRENITYGLDREATDEEVARAAKLANLYDYICTLPDGFDTDIGQLGGKLSGGQRQRIAIARMIIKDPDYLLLDEATCSLDAENEQEVQNALNEIMQGRTAVVVAHKLSTVQNADQIVVMAGGKVQAVGTHQQLYEANPLYRRYCELQLTGADE